MQRINQRDLEKGMLVVDVDSIETGCLFEVVEESTETQSLGLRLKSNSGFYEITVDEDGLSRFGRSTLLGEEPWYLPTKEEIELILNRDE